MTLRTIKAEIKPYRLEAVRGALIRMGASKMSVRPCRHFQRGKRPQDKHLRAEQRLDTAAKLTILAAVPAERANEAVGIILETARSGRVLVLCTRN